MLPFLLFVRQHHSEMTHPFPDAPRHAASLGAEPFQHRSRIRHGLFHCQLFFVEFMVVFRIGEGTLQRFCEETRRFTRTQFGDRQCFSNRFSLNYPGDL